MFVQRCLAISAMGDSLKNVGDGAPLMGMTMKQVLAVAVIAITSLAPGAGAQIARQGGPIDITSQELQVLDGERAAIFIGNVDAVQGDARLQTERLRVEFAPGGGGQGLGGDQPPEQAGSRA